MSRVLTLICHMDDPALDGDILAVAGSLSGATPIVLADGIAADFCLSSEPTPDEMKDFRSLMNEKRIDVAIQEAEGREKKFLIADMDSTIIQQECLDELAAFAGKKQEIAAITERAMRGELDFEAALRERVQMLRGLPVSVLQETLDRHISLMPGAAHLVGTMNARGAMTALVSGGFTFFTHRIAQAVGFQENQGNVLAVKDGHLTGEVEDPVFGREAKREALERICEFEGMEPSEVIAVGDGANDLDMLSAAGTGVAFHAKPVVAERAAIRIDHADLTALLYLQGIPRADFVTA